MKFVRTVCWVAVSLARLQYVFGQGVINSEFELSTIVSSHPSGYGFDTGTANVPGWTVYGAFGAVNYPGGMTIWYNNETLDAAGASLEGTSYWRPAIEGNYSIFLQGGTLAGGQYGTNGAAIGQVVQVPPTAQSLTYLGAGPNSLRITFNGQALSFIPVTTGTNWTQYGADISPYIGQTGELRFQARWLGGVGLIDVIQFSSSPIPEPSPLSLIGMGILFLHWRLKRVKVCLVSARFIRPR